MAPSVRERFRRGWELVQSGGAHALSLQVTGATLGLADGAVRQELRDVMVSGKTIDLSGDGAVIGVTADLDHYPNMAPLLLLQQGLYADVLRQPGSEAARRRAESGSLNLVGVLEPAAGGGYRVLASPATGWLNAASGG